MLVVVKTSLSTSGFLFWMCETRSGKFRFFTYFPNAFGMFRASLTLTSICCGLFPKTVLCIFYKSNHGDLPVLLIRLNLEVRTWRLCIVCLVSGPPYSCVFTRHDRCVFKHHKSYHSFIMPAFILTGSTNTVKWAWHLYINDVIRCFSTTFTAMTKPACNSVSHDHHRPLNIQVFSKLSYFMYDQNI